MSPSSYDAQKSERITQLEELLSIHQSELSEARKEQDRLRGLLEVEGGNTMEIDRKEEVEGDTAIQAKVRQSTNALLEENETLVQGEATCS